MPAHWLTKLCALGMFACAVRAATPAAEPRAVRAAFDQCSARLAHVTNFTASFNVAFDSLKGSVIMTGTIVQQPPFAFRRDLVLEETSSGTRKRECSLSDGTNGWQIECAPDGRIVNISRWGAASMEELFAVFLRNAQLLLLTPDRTSTYAAIRREVLFERVTPHAGGYQFTGRDRENTPAQRELLRIASAYGPRGISNFMTRSVTLIVGGDGLARELRRENLLGRVIECARLTDVRVNQAVPAALFQYAPPADALVLDLDRAMEVEPIHVPHPLRDKPAPPFTVQYLSGKSLDVKPGNDVIVLTFFTSWSENCRGYLPHLERAYRTYASRGVKFITVTDEKKQLTLTSLIKRARLTMPIYLDPGGVVTKLYRISVVPKTLIINRRGVVCDVLEGNARGVARELDAAIAAALR